LAHGIYLLLIPDKEERINFLRSGKAMKNIERPIFQNKKASIH
jgi:hypothetical protein